ncbi:MAG: hypothetical protein E7654_00930 [Ruminococcaceae bacterium]|nr:hypothetical protein [Oscillospiraceae bacterium]
MIEHDTVRLLRECDAGIKMGISSIDDVLNDIKDSRFKNRLIDSREEHARLQSETASLLARYHDDGKDPNPMAKGMSWMKTNFKLNMNDSDKTVADLLTDGCNMGVKSLSRYLNQYAAADENSKNITKRLIREEEQLCTDLRQYL